MHSILFTSWLLGGTDPTVTSQLCTSNVISNFSSSILQWSRTLSLATPAVKLHGVSFITPVLVYIVLVPTRPLCDRKDRQLLAPTFDEESELQNSEGLLEEMAGSVQLRQDLHSVFLHVASTIHCLLYCFTCLLVNSSGPWGLFPYFGYSAH